VLRHVRPKLACVRCQRVFQAAAPSRPIARGLPGPALLAHVMVGKYCDHQPLYRQSGIFARDGVEIDRSTLAGWVDKADDLIDPLVAAVPLRAGWPQDPRRRHAGEGAGTGRQDAHRAAVGVRARRPAGGRQGPRAAWFAYSADRGGEHPRSHLRGFRALQADAYAGWLQLYDGQFRKWPAGRTRGDPGGICTWPASAPHSLAAQALGRIRALYAIEDEIRGQPPDVRCAQRQARAGPLLKAMRGWLQAAAAGVGEVRDRPGHRLQPEPLEALTRYVDDGRLEIDNNAAERALRGVALGRKNYLFMGSHAGGERAAAFYSLVERPSSTVWTPRPTCARSSSALPSTRSTASRNCCRGTSAGSRQLPEQGKMAA
jgi:hypothetical protein